jgi:peptide/nickel transport system permease protein
VSDVVTTSELPAEAEVPATPVRTASAPKRPPLGISFWLCSSWLAVVGLSAVLAPVLPLKDPIAEVYTNVYPNYGKDATPSWQHLLGTDHVARDILSRIIWGSRVSLVIGLLATVIGIVIGSTLAMLSAYRQSRASSSIAAAFDNALVLFMYAGLAFPAIIAVLAILGFWGTSEFHIIVVLGLFSIPLIFRLVRAATLSVATREYVTAAKAQGATAFRVILREILPNIAPSIIAYTVFTIGGVIGTEGALGVLGLSVVAPTPTWGNMINDASGDPTNLSLVLAPALVLFLTIFCLYFASERIRLHFDTAESKL